MLRIVRFRRYRVFLVFAALVSLLLLRFSHVDWERFSLADTEPGQSPAEQDGDEASSHPLEAWNGYQKDAGEPGPAQIQISSASKVGTETPTPRSSSTSTGLAIVQTASHYVLPDRKNPVSTIPEEEKDSIHALGQPGRQEQPVFSAVPTTIHWEKQVEHFPVPTESLILLPTGPPASIPKIQHNFDDETPDAKINREKRQNKVKDEFQKAWNGYKTHAWLHDELSPISGKFRDPFCGWAATLVDSLDTLWIMGLEEEFEEAARAVDLIDFTTSQRSDIPVFETTIRYLGGLLAAYDLSGGTYKNLLDKAVELADILMGAFDTPNRMPDLYYRWKPAFASQPHRASQRSNTAELGSLGMEFTRLAQLTKNPHYYDAVARITNALSEWQDRGTKLDGVFPEGIDASGCNRSVPHPEPERTTKSNDARPNAKMQKPPEGFAPSMPKTVPEPKPKKQSMKGQGPSNLEVQIIPGQPSKAEIFQLDPKDNGENKANKRDLGDSGMFDSTNQYQAPIERDFDPEILNTTTSNLSTQPISGWPSHIPVANNNFDSSFGDWDCTPQGLEASKTLGRSKFSMGGSQDSTYEYFSKQFLLLGGREDKHRKMYLKTMDAVRKWMLYRPMVPGDPDILFSGVVTTEGEPETDLKLIGQVDHLTCFIGGMVGMGAKIFGLEGDLELAWKLTDGCVWAYDATPSGIMPEGATVLPCESAEQCTWNETTYWEVLDPDGSTRDHVLEQFIENKALRDAEKARLAEAELTEADQDTVNAEQAADILPGTQEEDIAEQEEKSILSALADPTHSTQSAPTSHPVSLEKRSGGVKDETLAAPPHNIKDDVAQAKEINKVDTANRPDAMEGASSLKEHHFVDKAEATESELLNMNAGRQAEVPIQEHSPKAPQPMPDLPRPLSHKEYVQSRIKQDSLPPGFLTIRSRNYILRPEAIESVWYMYRITGDSSWQDKGWKMFESIIKHTSAEFGHAALRDVTVKEPSQVDEMESFWLAETLKYFYLLYSTPDTISLDQWVLNTEAHPFKREM